MQNGIWLQNYAGFLQNAGILASAVILHLPIIRRGSAVLEKNWLILTPLTNSLQS